MNTPLQQAAQAVIDRWDWPLWKDQPYTSVYIAELRKALEAEQAQAVVLVITDECGRPVTYWGGKANSAPPAAPSTSPAVTGERAELIARLRSTAFQEDEIKAHAREAADMLEADAQEIARWRALAESNARLVDAVNQRHEREQRLAQQVAVPVPMTDIEVLRAARTVQSVFEHVPHRDVIEFVRAIEAHHGIGAKP